MGLLGELAVARVLALQIDTEARLCGDDGADLRLPDGRSVQVKYRQRRGWDYGLAGTDLGELADVNVLVWPVDQGWPPESVEVVGYLCREEFCAENVYVLDRRHGRRLWAKHKAFHPIEDLEGEYVLAESDGSHVPEAV